MPTTDPWTGTVTFPAGPRWSVPVTGGGAAVVEESAAYGAVTWRLGEKAVADPVGDIIGDYRAFAAQQRDRPITRGTDICPYPLSHPAGPPA